MLEPSEKGTICIENSNFIAFRIIISFTVDISKQWPSNGTLWGEFVTFVYFTSRSNLVIMHATYIYTANSKKVVLCKL